MYFYVMYICIEISNLSRGWITFLLLFLRLGSWWLCPCRNI